MNNRQSRNCGPLAMKRLLANSPPPAWLATLVFSLVACIHTLAGIPEPETVFYGKIINRVSGQELLLSEGTLKWVISKADGKQLTLQTKIGAVKGGEYSYRLNVPHQA